jgi:hypothetical protein
MSSEAQAKAVYDRYHDNNGEPLPGWLKAPNGKPTNLTEPQWVEARTAVFKDRFGEWERLARIKAIKNIKAKTYKQIAPLSKTDAENTFTSFSGVENIDGDKTRFDKGIVGKILSHKGFPTNTVIKHFDELYHNALFAEKEPVNNQHKSHPNFTGYKTYVNKFKVGKEDYYIRFTVQVEYKSKKQPNMPNHALHSSFISDVQLYNGNGSVPHSGIINPAGAPTTPIDNKLAQFLNSVNPSSVTIPLDENGEPIFPDNQFRAILSP